MNQSSTIQNNFTVQDAISLYQRLVQRGQKSTLARLSVEARCLHLHPQQRKLIHALLREFESQRV